MMTESLGGQLLTLVILAIPVACVTWTVIHEEVFREVREYFGRKSRTARHLPARKFYYLFTCEYCFSHYVAILALVLARFTLLLPGWRGYILAGFGLVWLANVYMALFVRLRLDIKHEVGEIAKVERQLEETPPARAQRHA
jgi:hypothetical protein